MASASLIHLNQPIEKLASLIGLGDEKAPIKTASADMDVIKQLGVLPATNLLGGEQLTRNDRFIPDKNGMAAAHSLAVMNFFSAKATVRQDIAEPAVHLFGVPAPGIDYVGHQPEISA